jgi:CBS domain-containing protein
MIAIAKPLLSLSAGDLMSRDLVMIPQDMSVRGAARMLSRAEISGAPVVDDQGRCIGVISATDFIHWAQGEARPDSSRNACACAAWQIIEEQDFPEGCVREIMTCDPVTAPPETSVGDLARMMLNAHIHRVIVVGRGGRPVGVVSSTDILAALAQADVQADQADH